MARMPISFFGREELAESAARECIRRIQLSELWEESINETANRIHAGLWVQWCNVSNKHFTVRWNEMDSFECSKSFLLLSPF